MQLSPEFGLTVQAVEKDGFPIAERVEMLSVSDAPDAIAESIGRGVIGYARALARLGPDLLVVLGDRFDMYPAAVAALPLAIPVAHIHGGELTEGAMDDALRHSMTKLSHLHFVASPEYATRVRQLGEEEWRITVSGSPGLDNLSSTPLLDREEMAAQFGLRLDRPFLLVTFHPVTLEFDQTDRYACELMAALGAAGLPVVFTQPNADTHWRSICARIDEFRRDHQAAEVVDTLGTQGYFSLMALAAAMVGNSSSGLIEAPSFELPVVNVGTRQGGRLRAANVIDVGYQRHEISEGLSRALDPVFRQSLAGLANPYGDGHAAERIVARLTSVPLGARLLTKRFRDQPKVKVAGVGGG